MASQFYNQMHRATGGCVGFYVQNHRFRLRNRLSFANGGRASFRACSRVSDGGDSSYLDMWRKAVDRERKTIEFQKIKREEEAAEESGGGEEDLEKKSNEFMKILEVSPEERDRIQKMQVIDRAAAAIVAARAFVSENLLPVEIDSGSDSYEFGRFDEEDNNSKDDVDGNGFGIVRTPGPNFWSWAPPPEDGDELGSIGKASSPLPNQGNPVMELEESYVDYLSLPFQSKSGVPPLPPFQSLMEVQKQDSVSGSTSEKKHDDLFSTNAQEAADALGVVDDSGSCQGIHPDGSRWWKETGTEVRSDGVVCRWTLTRGISADKSVEWEDKYWEAADEFDYKELGSEKSGRDASGNVWREFWKESMFLVEGSLHIEKTADKWGANGKGDKWQEKWFEHYGGGQAEKWAHKWCSIDPNTQLEAGHAHVWHERWGEKYDGEGGSVKYSDKWAERSEGDGWTKWGDKWDENFDPNGCGVKQGETWWEGKYGERWNRTWGEGHNGSGWVHKYGKSSSGEHWDTHVEQETWYERYPHFGFYHCFENSVSLREVKKPSEWK